ncbi:beta-mannanase/endoglucanase A-like [Lampris incognitus]|uniref:beta-mannanase/endoglucanase A-like n=1 Tax=Lampris incognitus TaxID=2546036 RepID=UPI0024B5C1BD|nr:beta-mannanase/endoglucanase A-like [Lampris incognitus]
MTATPSPNMTATPNPNMTATPNPNMTATPSPNMTTTPSPNMTATPSPNMTAVPGHNMTTTPGPNMTTTAQPATTAAKLEPNTTVESLQGAISRTDCGKSELCAAQPEDCDPSEAGSCFFVSAKRTNGQNFEFALAGESDGYVAASLSTDTALGGNDTTYVCANNNGMVQFFGAVLNNNVFMKTELNVNSVKGRVTGNKIECTFAATVPVSRNRASLSFSMAVSTGSFNNGTLGKPNTRIQTNIVDLSNSNSTVTNQIQTTTVTPTTTPSGAVVLQQSLSQALMISLGVLILAML